MSESDGTDSFLGNNAEAVRDALRQRVIESIAAGASRREAAKLYGISPSIAMIWAQR